ncbi:hypothetical protein AGABI2DRAFT_191046 [Agaricus bisporus var. bisporus H97]|uniref:hypothetical protein n=1 Tax=Agaricus bisporus var. bisporus (strain H97 / ATCC MYA-4626 / FGSC 10389) TaxID=936046 RepID=UPI00029F5988|nr:hypothetical protein AGABI2DRAFT_191046 [Agaricus bisporus var. bisporus H97]EKV48851.1 hypothetical protein AGABI2DRAFT_191046 [Agaricus bisporus var. bisporus H97]
MAGIPSTFTIGNQGNVASIGPIGDFCSVIAFHPPGNVPPAIWSAVPVEGGMHAIQHSNTGDFATAMEGRVLACPDFSPEAQSSFRLVRNNDGTFLVQLNNSRAIWTVRSDGSLRLGPAISAGPQNTFFFIQA